MLRKIAEIKVPTGAGAREAKTEPVFASYDRQGAAFAFYFSDSNVAGTKANLLFVIDGQKVFVDDDVTLGETNETHTFTYPLPDELLNYTGKIDGYLYFDFEDGSHSDEIHFVFTIKKSKIDEEMEEAPDVYIKSFEDIKAEVQEAADGAKETISQKVTEVSDTSDSAISKFRETKEDVTQSAADATDSIDKAKTTAETTISEHVSSVGSAKEAAEKRIDDAVESTESARDDAVKAMNELDYSDRNLIVTSNLSSYSRYSTQPVVEENGRKITISYKENKNELVTLKVAGWKLPEGKYTLSGRIEINGEPVTQETFPSKKIHTGHPNSANERFDVLSDGTIIVTEYYDANSDYYILQTNFDGLSDGDEIAFYDLQFQPGSVPTPWQPAFGDYDAKIKKLEEAITNLGGSV